MTSPILLTPIQARILATLMEKARTVPDSYPMTLNSLILGCNQKTSRDPVLQVEEAQALEAIDGLRDLNLVHEALGGRTTRYTHNFQRGIGVPEQSAVLLALLMLRGPQTAGELRLNAERWHRFADISSVDAFLDELQERSAEKGGPLVVPLPRTSGARETRWMHLLCGPVDMAAFSGGAAHASGAGAPGGLQARVETLEQQVAELRGLVQRLHAELGLAMPAAPEDPGASAASPS